MLNVFICEDIKKQLDKLTEIIKNIIIIEDLDMHVTLATQNPREILDYIEREDCTGVYFLDIDLKDDINGIKLGEKIREIDPRGFIIFITTHAEMSLLTFKYKVEALDYIIKDDFEDVKKRIHDCLLNVNGKYLRKKNDIQKIFHVKNGYRTIHVDFNKIMFFETSETIHKVKLHAEDRQIEFYGKIHEVVNGLDDRFHRCHRSYIVNKDKISEIDKKTRVIYLDNGQKCSASVRGIKGLY